MTAVPRRRAALVVALLVCATALGVVTPQRAEASCAGPFIGVGAQLEETGAVPEAAVPLPREAVVTGLWFRSGCDDSGQGPGPGCTAAPDSEEGPRRDVDLVLTQRTGSWSLGSADAGDREDGYPVTWDVSVPSDVAAGPATLTAGSAALAVDLAAPGT